MKTRVDWHKVGQQHAVNGFAFQPSCARGVTEQMEYAAGYITGEGLEGAKADLWLAAKKRETQPPPEAPGIVWVDGWPYSRPRR